jgi:hypothetical protein
MRPVIKKKRIDPRYFLHETVEEGVRFNVAEDDDEDSPEAKEHDEKPNDKDGDGVPDEKEKNGRTQLLKGEKSLYEKIRSAIEEVLDEYSEGNK